MAAGPAFSKPVAGDYNNDGISDLAAIKDGSTLHIWNGEGGSRFGPADSRHGQAEQSCVVAPGVSSHAGRSARPPLPLTTFEERARGS
ncbi:hypothetical protein SAMN05444920_106324 [Nonomuraea solani]|uniref:Repeat domain-containing protein n=1 Tax=Nonomuraea solani TaxID=1144553 RepID=A0A1H6DUE1_9ACTN|nr:hypothetical protein SAMN05444920_106324 [Nonomuraea solani]